MYTTDLEQLEECEHIMVLLSEATWTRGEESVAFTSEVERAMSAGVHRFLIHEVPGARLGDQEQRQSCRFERFFEEGVTPGHLIKAGIYGEIAMNLGPDEWRRAGLIKTIEKLSEPGSERKPPWRFWSIATR